MDEPSRKAKLIYRSAPAFASSREASVAGLCPESQLPTKMKDVCQHKHFDQTLIPARYRLEAPKPADTDAPRDIAFVSIEPFPLFLRDGRVELLRLSEHAHNVKTYRYQPCVADPDFPHKQYFRATDLNPPIARLSFEDSDKGLCFDNTGTIVSTSKGWRSCRANVWAREGRWFFEVEILQKPEPLMVSRFPGGRCPPPHVRVGFSRREASLDCPVGFDAFSYGISDARLEAMHRSRPTKIITSTSTSEVSVPIPTHLKPGDVIGLEICLPPLQAHHQTVCGSDFAPCDPSTTPNTCPTPFVPNVVRDRVPIPYRGLTYFESFEYQATKPMEAYNDRSPHFSSHSSDALSNRALSQYHQCGSSDSEPALRGLPSSYIRIWINGRFVGTPFSNLLPFLPPASSVPTLPTAGVSARPNLDDGTLGYYPTVSVFSNGTAAVRFGPEFRYPPPNLVQLDTLAVPLGSAAVPLSLIPSYKPDRETGHPPLRPFQERFEEQIAEDILWDLIDEATFFVVDGGLR